MRKEGEKARRGLTTDLDRCFELEEDGLVYKDLARLGAEELDLVLLQLHLLPWPVAAHCARASRQLPVQPAPIALSRPAYAAPAPVLLILIRRPLRPPQHS